MSGNKIVFIEQEPDLFGRNEVVISVCAELPDYPKDKEMRVEVRVGTIAVPVVEWQWCTHRKALFCVWIDAKRFRGSGRYAFKLFVNGEKIPGRSRLDVQC